MLLSRTMKVGRSMSTPSDAKLANVIMLAVSDRIRAGTSFQEIPWPQLVVALIDWAQTEIDFYGLASFFELDYPGNPPYPLFAEAYRVMGADVVGDCIAAVAAMFPFPEPHLKREERMVYLQGHYADKTGPLAVGSDRMMAFESDELYARLAAYARENALVSATT